MDDDNATEYMHERAAIMQYDGGLKRHEAEYFAVVATWRFCNRTGKSPPDDYRYKLHVRRFTGDEPRDPGERDSAA